MVGIGWWYSLRLVLAWDHRTGALLLLCGEDGTSMVVAKVCVSVVEVDSVVVAGASVSLFSLPSCGCDERKLSRVG